MKKLIIISSIAVIGVGLILFIINMLYPRLLNNIISNTNESPQTEEDLNKEIEEKTGIVIDTTVQPRESTLSSKDITVVNFRNQYDLVQQGQLQIDNLDNKQFLVIADFSDPMQYFGPGSYIVTLGNDNPEINIGELIKQPQGNWLYTSKGDIDISQYKTLYIQYQSSADTTDIQLSEILAGPIVSEVQI